MDVTSSTLIGNKGLILNFVEGSTAYLIAFHPPGIFNYIWHHLSTWVFSRLWGRPQMPNCIALWSVQTATILAIWGLLWCKHSTCLEDGQKNYASKYIEFLPSHCSILCLTLAEPEGCSIYSFNFDIHLYQRACQIWQWSSLLSLCWDVNQIYCHTFFLWAWKILEHRWVFY